MSRYQATWDVSLVFEMLREWNSNCDLSLKMLSLKLFLLMLLSLKATSTEQLGSLKFKLPTSANP